MGIAVGIGKSIKKSIGLLDHGRRSGREWTVVIAIGIGIPL